MRDSCEEGYDYAEGYSACATDQGNVGWFGLVLKEQGEKERGHFSRDIWRSYYSFVVFGLHLRRGVCGSH